MTRINADLDPAVLLDQHLLAERRELPMVYASLRRSLKGRNLYDVFNRCPSKFTLNTGHVSFFYLRLKFLQSRYERLNEECLRRGYNIDLSRTYDIREFPEECFGEYYMTREAFDIITQRILLRHSAKPNWYTYNGDRISTEAYKLILEGSMLK
jgi:deoxyribonuclease (pyrimidine dimer)